MIRPLKNLDDILKTSGPLFVMKHSSTCPISAAAWEEFQGMPGRTPNAAYAMLVVQEARALSNEIANRFSIKHESPQVILFVDGATRGVLNHHDITVDHMTVLLSGGKTSPH